MLDNMDGITGIVSLVISSTMLICLWVTNNTDSLYFIVITGMISGLTGFLFFNWFTSKMFMGDSGSQFLGVILASLGIIFLWNLEPLQGQQVSIAKKILFPLMAFIVPIADTTTVVINRISRGQSPFVGGKDHTTHNLARIGLSNSQVALTVMLVSLVSSLIIVSYYTNEGALSVFEIIFLSLYVLCIMLGLFFVTQYNRKR
jgi:UDP-GlcNAc:undecaprenyl-phosphate GlcNAc-1-phosphate transferase